MTEEAFEINQTESNISINKVILQGIVANTPILRKDNNKTFVTNFGINTVETIKSSNNNPNAKISKKHNIVAWGDLAKRCCNEIEKDMTIYVEGSLNYITKNGKSITEIKLTYINNGKSTIINTENNIDIIEQEQ